MPTFTNETDAVNALRQYSHQCRPVSQAGPLRIPPQGAARRGLLDEADSLALLAEFGIPVVVHREIKQNSERANVSSAETGAPVHLGTRSIRAMSSYAMILRGLLLYSETTAKLLKSLEGVFVLFPKAI